MQRWEHRRQGQEQANTLLKVDHLGFWNDRSDVCSTNVVGIQLRTIRESAIMPVRLWLMKRTEAQFGIYEYRELCDLKRIYVDRLVQAGSALFTACREINGSTESDMREDNSMSGLKVGN
jgi:hypothetical protein